jgi:hypothetical protein
LGPTYQVHVRKLRDQSSSTLRSVVNLDIKTKKWKDTPDDVVNLLTVSRGRMKALTEACTQFGGTLKADATRMERAKALSLICRKGPSAERFFMRS